ncbi:MAG: hypothetical protein JST21_03340 [Bacteroidetes bacterium]|nr:hypothetical protein [Bacteroidota bacterium]
MRNQVTIYNQYSTGLKPHCYFEKMKYAAVLFILLLSSLNVFSQSVSASLDRNKILLGEQVTLNFTLNNLNEHGAFVSSWPQINDTVNHVEVLKRSKIDTLAISDTYTYQQNFTLTSFDSGRWQIGPFTFLIKDKISGETIKLTTSTLYITVLPVDVSAMTDYHAMKEIIDVPVTFDWMPVLIALVVILIALIAFLIIRKQKMKPKEAPGEILIGTPLERAIEKLQALEKTKLASTTDIKRFHTDIDEITRKYFEEMTQVKALQLTTSELFGRLHVYLQDNALRNSFLQVFETNASVKFAKYTPQTQESKNTLKAVINSLQQIDDIVNTARNHANRLVQKY